MGLRLVFLGRLEDVAGEGERTVALVPGINALFASLEPALVEALQAPRVKIALNGALLQGSDSPLLKDGDEIAFLPPVSGG